MFKLDALNQPAVLHGFFTRRGGVSDGIYGSLNCGLGSKDNNESVHTNREEAMRQLGLSLTALHTCFQHHSADAVLIDDNTNNAMPLKADGLVTATRGIALGILTADCGPVLFADPIAKVIGAAHAGWRGALSGILENTVRKMCQCGASPSNIIAGLGPMIGPKSYEVGPEFLETFLDSSAKNLQFFSATGRSGYRLFDLPSYIQHRIELIGIKLISSLGQDTYQDKEQFFSYRRACHQNEPDYGRLLSAIALR